MPGDFCSSFDCNWNQNKNSYQQGFKKKFFCLSISVSTLMADVSLSLACREKSLRLTNRQIPQGLHIFLSLTMTWTWFYCKMNQRLCKKAFSKSHFPICLGTVSSYSILARYSPKNCKSGNPPHSLLTAAFELVSMKVFLFEVVRINTEQWIQIQSPFLWFCLGPDWKCRTGPLQQRCSCQLRSNDFQGSKTSHEFLWTQTSGPFTPSKDLCNAVQFAVWQNDLKLRFLMSVIKVPPSIKFQ